MRKCAYVYDASYACVHYFHSDVHWHFLRGFVPIFGLFAVRFLVPPFAMRVSVCVCAFLEAKLHFFAHSPSDRSFLHSTSSALAANITEICALHFETLFWCKRSQPFEIVCVCVGVCGCSYERAHFILCTPCIYRLSLVLQLHLCYASVHCAVLVCMHVWMHVSERIIKIRDINAELF